MVSGDKLMSLHYVVVLVEVRTRSAHVMGSRGHTGGAQTVSHCPRMPLELMCFKFEKSEF